MQWKVGEHYKLQSGSVVRILAIDAPKLLQNSVHYPIVSMSISSGGVHHHKADGTSYASGFNLVPRVRRIEGWMAAKTVTDINKAIAITSLVYKNREDIPEAWNPDCHIIPVSFEIPEEE